MPENALSAVFDCDSATWSVIEFFNAKEFYSSESQEWPSWVLSDNGRWYAPVEPQEIQVPQAWDEVEQSWHVMLPREAMLPPRESQRQMFPSWIQRGDGMWVPPISAPENCEDCGWFEPAMQWLTLDEMKNFAKNAV